MNMNVIKLHHYAVTAPGVVLKEMINFYDDILGLKAGYRPDFGVRGYWLYAGDQPILHLLEDDNRIQNEKGFFDHIALRCSELETTKAKLDAADVSYTEFGISDLNQIQILITDPAENTIELNFLNQ